MKRTEAGTTTMGYVIVGGIVLILLVFALTRAGILWGDHEAKIKDEAYARGAQETSARYEKRDNVRLVAANAEISRLNAVARGEEGRKQEAVDAAVTKANKEKKDVQKKLDDFRDGLRRGTILLRDPGARPPGTGAGLAGSCSGPGGAAPGDPAGGPRLDGGGVVPRQDEGVVLSAETSDFLVAEAARADRKLVALQLCRATVLIYRSKLEDAGASVPAPGAAVPPP